MALTLSKRMDIVEQKLAGLESLPERMTALESQFLQLRTEMRAEFSATRTEMQAGDEGITRTLREEIRTSVDEATHTLREEIRAGDEETRRVLREEIAGLGTHMRVLHEDLVEKIKLTQEGRPSGRRPRR
jgi:F0F1-type ATP synthase membrane subunit b/b'